jgi:hypothetical protein
MLLDDEPDDQAKKGLEDRLCSLREAARQSKQLITRLQEARRNTRQEAMGSKDKKKNRN